MEISPEILLILVFLIAIFPNSKKQEAFLSVGITNEIKGLAILLIFLFHIPLSSTPELAKYGNYGVGVFLLLSGYGLYCSSQLKQLSAKVFFGKRVARVLVPAFLVLVLILVLWYFLPRMFINSDMSEDSFFSDPTSLLYFTLFRAYLWFVPFIFFWYLCYFLASNSGFSERLKTVAIFFAGFLIIASRPFAPDFLWYWFMFPLCFPAGVLIAQQKNRIENAVSGLSEFKKGILFIFSVFCLLFALFLKEITAALPYESIHYPISSLLFAIGFLYVFSRIFQSRRSLFLGFMGGIAYEFFLVHGVFFSATKFLLSSGATLFGNVLFNALVVFFASVVFSLALSRTSKGINSILGPGRA